VKWFSQQWLPDEEIDKLIFATHEAVINALRERCRTRCVLGVAWLIVGRVG